MTQEQQLERITGIKNRIRTLQILIQCGHEAQHGPLGAIERAESHRITRNAEQELEQQQLELAKATS